MIYQLLLASICLAFIILSIVVTHANLLGNSRIFLITYLLGTLFWGGGVLYELSFVDPDIPFSYGTKPYIIAQFLFFGALLAMFSIYGFAKSYKNNSYVITPIDKLSLFLLFCGTIIAFCPDSFFTSLTFREAGYVDFERSWGGGFMSFYIFYFYVLTINTLRLRIKTQKNKIYKYHLKSILWAYLLFMTSAIFTNWVLSSLLKYPQLNGLGPSFYIFEALVLFYSTAQYRFFDIKLTFLRILKSILAFILAVFISSLVLIFLENFSNFNFSDTYFFILEGALVLIIYFQMIWIFDSRFMNDIFGEKSAKHFRLIIDEFRDTHFLYKSIPELRRTLSMLFLKDLDIDSFNLVILDEKNRKKYKSVINYFEHHNNDVLVIEEIPYLEIKTDIKFEIPNKIKKNGEVFIPLANPVKGIIAILILGRKKREIYLSRELKTLKTFGHYLSLLLTGILYNTDLKNEVKLKTKQLAIKNKKLKDSYKKLKIFDEAKDNFLAIASHELRTPMTVIKGYTDFLLSEEFGKLNKRQLLFVDYIKESTNDLLVLVNDMLDLSKIESGKMEFQYEKISLSKCIDSLKSGFSVECEQRGINFSILISKDLPKYMILDPQKVRLIMTNLIGNAMKFTPKDGSIVVDISRKKENIKVSITDTGIGIKKENLSNIFDKFFQEKNHLKKEYKGTGLGLAIVKKILETIGGCIYVKSEVGKGTTFTFELPIKTEI